MSNPEAIWNEAKVTLKTVLNADTYNRWIAGIVPLEHRAGQFILGVADDMFCEWLSINYQEMIESALMKVLDEKVAITFESGHGLPSDEVAPKAPQKKTSTTPQKTRGDHRFNRQFTFANFVVGENNSFAHAASYGVSQSPGIVYNPLFLHSPSGLGKTHLLQAVANETNALDPKRRIEYISGEEFSNAYIDAIQANRVSEFRAKYRNVDVLLIDDVQFFTGKTGLQEEFFHTFNALYNGHKQIVLTCDRPPHEIDGLEKRLVSRFEWGLIADMLPPDLETRTAILRKKQEAHKVKLPEDVLSYIAECIKSNIRRLEGALIRLVSYASLTNKTVDLAIAKKQLAGLVEEEASPTITIERIQKIVAERFNLHVADLVGSRRPRNIAIPRQIAMYLCRRLTNASSPEIGKTFNRNHATILHAVSATQKRLDEDMTFRRDIDAIEKLLQTK